MRAPHLSCIGATRESLRDALAAFAAAGHHAAWSPCAATCRAATVPARSGEFRYASDLVAFIRAETGDVLPHRGRRAIPRCTRRRARRRPTCRRSRAKVSAGASSAITQMLLQRRRVLPLRRRGARLRCRHPDRAGHHADHQLDAAHALRRQLRRRHPALDPLAAAELRRRHARRSRRSASTWSRDLCERLQRGGAPGLHFYTMNQARRRSRSAGASTCAANRSIWMPVAPAEDRGAQAENRRWLSPPSTAAVSSGTRLRNGRWWRDPRDRRG